MRQQKRDRLKKNINTKFKNMLESELGNPMVKATQSWSTVSEMLQTVLGKEVHKQWFQNITPIVLKNDILILQTQDHFSASWINTHYQELVESILKIQSKKYSCFFIAPKSLKSAAAKINRDSKSNKSQR